MDEGIYLGFEKSLRKIRGNYNIQKILLGNKLFGYKINECILFFKI